VSFALFAVNPLLFMGLRLREAIMVAVPVNLVPPVGVALEEGVGDTFAWVIPMALLSIGAAVLTGTYIGRIVVQSEERAALINELELSRAEVARLSTQAERARIAAEIHDTLAQGFTSLVTLVQAAESELDSDPDKARRHLALAARTARENLGEARALVAGLTPSALGTGSLDEAIARQVERLVEETGIRAGYRAEGGHRELPTVIEVVLLRAVQESLTNVRKHSGAREVSISLRVNESGVVLRVCDDGCGFDPAAAFDGFGLLSMRNRAAQVGGALSIYSGPGEGATVELEVPL
jgi:signal transduction histidine kinase